VELVHVNLGFSSQGVLTMHMAVTRAKYREDERVADYYQRMVDRGLFPVRRYCRHGLRADTGRERRNGPV